MYLKRLEISGFKSFAGKTAIDLEPGISAVVGPNGSGKSNIADAIRWAMGEQTVKNLRLKKTEQVVFAGTAKRPRGSMAAVSMLLDNSDGQAAIDFSEIEISRIYYRSGESEYRLNGKKALVREIQDVLSRSGLAVDSYSVIGQGTIDSLVLSSPAERKLLFDEASGIRSYELKREQALRKLDATDSNLTRAKDILKELTPRLESLTQLVESARHRQGLSGELSEVRRQLIQTGLGLYDREARQYEQKIEKLQNRVKSAVSEIAQLDRRRTDMQSRQAGLEKTVAGIAAKIGKAEIERDKLTNRLSVAQAELSHLTDNDQSGEHVQARLTGLREKITEAGKRCSRLRQKLDNARAEERSCQEILDKKAGRIKQVQTELNQLRQQIDSSGNAEYIDHALVILRQIIRDLDALPAKQVELSLYKIGRLLDSAKTVPGRSDEGVRNLQRKLIRVMGEREDAHDTYTKAAIKTRSLEIDCAHAEDRRRSLEEELAQAEAENTRLPALHEKAVKSKTDRVAELEKKLAALDQEISKLRSARDEALGGIGTSEQVFDLARSLESKKSEQESLQDELREARSGLSQANHDLSEFRKLAGKWFSGEKIAPASAASQDRLDKLQERQIALSARLEETADSDQDSLSEHEAVSQRHLHLTEQVADLEKAKADLLKIISQLEKLISDRFEKAFHKISHRFGEHFQDLFGGGTASLSLEKDESGAFGIEIKAQPPGKRVEGLAVLSGGERSLTGIALLAAILSVNPSPFVVLDEVDAALDEANSLRFARILKQLSKKSQMILITHNRETMQAAHSLFGVTMDKHHVSSLLSVRLEQAEELAKA